MYIAAFIIILGVLIFVHELGHFLAAKGFGVRVDEFALGFPPKIVSKKVGNTEYILNALRHIVWQNSNSPRILDVDDRQLFYWQMAAINFDYNIIQNGGGGPVGPNAP